MTSPACAEVHGRVVPLSWGEPDQDRHGREPSRRHGCWVDDHVGHRQGVGLLGAFDDVETQPAERSSGRVQMTSRSGVNSATASSSAFSGLKLPSSPSRLEVLGAQHRQGPVEPLLGGLRPWRPTCRRPPRASPSRCRSGWPARRRSTPRRPARSIDRSSSRSSRPSTVWLASTSTRDGGRRRLDGCGASAPVALDDALGDEVQDDHDRPRCQALQQLGPRVALNAICTRIARMPHGDQDRQHREQPHLDHEPVRVGTPAQHDLGDADQQVDEQDDCARGVQQEEEHRVGRDAPPRSRTGSPRRTRRRIAARRDTRSC